MARVLHDFLTPEECAALIVASEGQGYADAPVTMGDSAIIIKDYRDNLRVMEDDPALAERLYLHAKPFLPDKREGRRLVGFNERLRYYRYDPGHVFAPHYDGSFRRNAHEESQLTILIYLNEDCLGGTTDFYNEDESLQFSVQPKQGMALVFRHEILHGGGAVRQGRKYVLRSDVMYSLSK